MGAKKQIIAEKLRVRETVLLRRLLAAVMASLGKIKSAQKRALKLAWGVDSLPSGVKLGTLQTPNDLRLQDGSVRCGPSRLSIVEVSKDLAEIQTLQRTHGDAVACAELERRDVDAMTALFMKELDK